VFTVTADKGLTPSGFQLFPASTLYTNDGTPAAYKIPLVGTPAQTVRVTFTLNNQGQWFDAHYWVLEGSTGGVISAHSNIVAAGPASSVPVTLPAQGAQTLLLGAAQQRGAIGTCVFNNFGGGLSPQGAGTTAGIDDVAVLDTVTNRNFASARGSMLMAAAGIPALQANFANSYARPSINVIAIPPTVVPGAGTVQMHYEGGLDTCSMANGEIELTFEPNGIDVWVKMSQ
jgi:hypothetical protein